MSIDEETDIIEAIVKSHKSGKVAFHVAYDQLIKEHGLTEEQAYELLFPHLMTILTWFYQNRELLGSDLSGKVHDEDDRR